MTATSTLPPTIRSYLTDFVVRARWIALARSAAIALAWFIGWMLLCCLVDRYVQLPRGVRLASLVIGVVAVLGRLIPRLIALRKPADLILAAAEVERQNPRFGQRLLTVTSRLLGQTTYRGSDEILIRLAREVGDQVADSGNHGRLSSFGQIAGPLIACSLLIVAVAGLLGAPASGFATLAARFVNPMADIPPVTTTQLVVAPGNVDVTQSRPVNVEVRVERLGDSQPTLFLSGSDRDWTRVAMSPAGSGRYNFTVASVDRDIRYYVTGGDARSPEYLLRVLRAPAISQFSFRYQFPPYTRLPPMLASNADGRIEAPAGTRVLIRITATEPLQSALLTFGNDRVLMDRGKDPYSRQAELVVRADGKYAIDLISAREVAGVGPSGTYIRAVPDLPPQVRLARGGDTLRLSPRGIVPVWYEALDDYGIKSLELRAQLNDQAAVISRVPLWGDPRRQQDVYNFDLATLPLGIGDIVTLTASATDTAGHSTDSLPLHVVVSPRSIDLDSWERIGELRTAAQLSRSLVAQLEDAVKARSEADGMHDHASTAFLAAQSRGDRALSAASQTAALLRQSLLRATTHSSSASLSVALSSWVDLAEFESAVSDDAFRQSGAPGGLTPAQRDRLRSVLDRARSAQAQIAAVQLGEQATAVLSDRENLQDALKRPAPKDEATRRRLRETVERMRQDISADAGQMGLDGASNDLENQLRNYVRAEEEVVSAAKPVDFYAAASQWVRQIRHDPQQRLGLEGRLSAAAQAEAIRPDADLIRARDMELASRAASTLAACARAGRMPPSQSLDGFVVDLNVLLSRPESERKTQAAGRAAAQQDLIRIANDPTTVATRATSVAAEERQKDAETLALQASAAAADRQYDRATAFDQALARRLQQPVRHEAPATNEAAPAPASGRLDHQQQAVQREMATARSLDDLTQEQNEIGGAGSAATRPAATATEQRDVADRIADVERQREEGSTSFTQTTVNGRDRAASEVLSAQEQLSSMPQALAAALAAAAARREAGMRAGMAADTARSAPADQKAAADRAAAEADQNAREAANRLEQALEPVSPKAVQSLSDRLEQFAPETDSARAALLGQLAPSMESVTNALRGSDAGAADRSADEARRSMEACQRELASTQDVLMRRDPLVAARWFAKAAAESLSLLPPDVGHARFHQANASAALSRAWDQSIHKAAAERLATLPSLASILGMPPAPSNAPGGQQGSRFAAAREWGRMRPQEGPELNSSMHDADPPGYEASLKLYFEALSKAQGVK